MLTATHNPALVRGKLQSLGEKSVVLAVDHCDYRLDLALPPQCRSTDLAGKLGARITGTIHAKALRMHQARAGGRFIEPLEGKPRIVQGFVLAVDEPGNRVLLDCGALIWVTPTEGDGVAGIRGGELFNFYVQSGTSFAPEP